MQPEAPRLVSTPLNKEPHAPPSCQQSPRTHPDRGPDVRPELRKRAGGTHTHPPQALSIALSFPPGLVQGRPRSRLASKATRPQAEGGCCVCRGGGTASAGLVPRLQEHPCLPSCPRCHPRAPGSSGLASNAPPRQTRRLGALPPQPCPPGAPRTRRRGRAAPLKLPRHQRALIHRSTVRACVLPGPPPDLLSPPAGPSPQLWGVGCAGLAPWFSQPSPGAAPSSPNPSSSSIWGMGCRIPRPTPKLRASAPCAHVSGLGGGGPVGRSSQRHPHTPPSRGRLWAPGSRPRALLPGWEVGSDGGTRRGTGRKGTPAPNRLHLNIDSAVSFAHQAPGGGAAARVSWETTVRALKRNLSN